MDERHEIQVQIDALKNKLSSDSSSIGDWKIDKILEYRAVGKEDPYNMEELATQRQAARDEINALEAQLAALGEEEVNE